MPAAVDRDKCTGCAGRERIECVFNCPYEAISMEGGGAVVNSERCDDCKICVDSCPVAAIHHE